ncbi:hypothetical protein Tco_0959087, partial [Tanacetum coccineum]
IVMSDSEDSTVTYTMVSSPFRGMLDIGSPRVDGPPVMPEDPYAYVVSTFQAPPSFDYVPGPEEPEQAPLSPEFIPEPIYLDFMPPEDEDPTDYPVDGEDDDDDESSEDDEDDDDDVKEEEDEKEEEEEHPAPADSIPPHVPVFNIFIAIQLWDPTDYPVDEEDDDDDESSEDDEDDDDDVKEEEDEEEHPAPADSVPPPVHRVTARMSIRDEPPTPFWPEAEIARLLAIPSPPPSTLSPWSSPLPQIPSPPLPVSSPVPISPLPLPASPTYPLGYRAVMIRQRAESPSTSRSLPLPPPIILSHTRAFVAMMRAATPSTYILASRSETPPSGTQPLLPIPLPISSLPLLLRYEVGESSSAPAARPTGGFRADYGFVATLDREIRRDPERDVGYGIIDTWDEMLKGMPGAPANDETELGRRMTNLVTTIRQDTDEIYRRLDEAHEARVVLSGRLKLLDRDRRSHAYTALLMEREAKISYEAWGHEDCSLVSSKPRSTGTACGDTKTDEYTADTGDSTTVTAGTR